MRLARYPRMSGANPPIRQPRANVPTIYMDDGGYDYQCGTCPRCHGNDPHRFRIFAGWARCTCGFYEESPRWKIQPY